ncbi:hypothetical protein BGZ95_002872 [Linnemannia exigua]|uniref:Uncharacterized protein n=1 Tax=Linnemannia exigua TaxID=604196 RepID=A0AAD4H2N9_9FUNG|nr:hypothetical protein BGZ95_002872 [Linnemannia exigua]
MLSIAPDVHFVDSPVRVLNRCLSSWTVVEATEGYYTIDDQDNKAESYKIVEPPVVLEPASGSLNQLWQFERAERI